MKIVLFGGTGGIGTQITKKLSTKHECISVGSQICDVTNEENVKSFLESIDYDIVVYLCVKNVDNLIHKQTNDDIKKQIDVGIMGFLNVLRHCTPKLRNKKWGRIIYTSSILSDKPIRGTGIYSSIKSFCETIIKTYALENAKYGITANVIQLGYFDEGMIKNVPDEIINKILPFISLQRLGKTSEITSLIETIIETEYINGAVIPINGGYGI